MRIVVGTCIALALAAGVVWWLGQDESPPMDGDVLVDDLLQGPDDPRPGLEGREALALGVEGALPTARGVNRIEGRVERLDGSPVADTVVLLKRQVRQPRHRNHTANRLSPERVGVPARAKRDAGATRTDADGRFTFRGLARESYAVHVETEPPLYANAAWAWVHMPVAEVTVVVDEGLPLRVRVVDGAGQPLRATLQCSAQVMRADDTSTSWIAAEATTDGEGRYAYPAVPEGAVRFSVGVKGRGWRYGVSVDVPHDGEATLVFDDPDGVVVEGAVKDTSGDPVVGARVSASTRGLGDQWEHSYMTATSGADGTYRIVGLVPGKLQQMQAAAPGFLTIENGAPVRTVVASETVRVDLTMVRGGVITGRVTGPAGEAIGGASVIALAQQGSRMYARQVSGATDADGKYRVEGVPLGEGTVRATARGFYLPRDDEHPDTRFEIDAEGQALERDLVLLRGVPVTGRVLDAEGAPVPSATVEVQGRTRSLWNREDGTSVTDDEGRFTLAGLPPGPQWTFTAKSDHGVSDPVEHAIEEGAAGLSVELLLRPGAALHGRVEVDGAAPDNKMRVHVRLKSETGGRRVQQTINTQDGGTFEVTGLRAGEYEVYPVDHHHSACGEKQHVTLEWGQRLEIVVASGRLGEIAGRVIDTDGEPLSRISVRLKLETPSRNMSSGNSTDRDGKFRFTAMPEGEYTLEIDGQKVATAAIGETDLEFVHTRSAKDKIVVEGSVLGPDGTPVASGNLTLYQVRKNGRSGHGEPIAAGVFRVEATPDSRFETLELVVTEAFDALGRRMNIRPLVQTVEPGANVELRLEEGLAIAGRVVDAQGNPVEGVGVKVQTDNRGQSYVPHRRRTSATTDADGRFRHDGLGEGAYRVFITVPAGFVPPAVEPVDAGTEDLLYELEQGARVSGRIVDASGEPVSKVSVQFQWTIPKVHPNGSTYQQNQNRQARTGADGTFEIVGIPTGVEGQVIAQPPSDGTSALLRTTLNNVTSGETGVAITLQVGVRIEGTVVGPDGKAVENVWINCRPKEHHSGGQHTNGRPEGTKFSIGPMAPGVYMLSVHAQAAYTAPPEMEVTAPSSGIEIRLTQGNPVEGKVVGEHGKQTIVYFIVMENGHPNVSGSGISGDSFTIARGDDEAGTLFAHDGERYALIEGVKPSGGPFELKLVEGKVIEGHMDGELGEHGGWVYARSTTGVHVQAQVGDDGAFALKGLPDGSYTLTGWSHPQQYEEVKGVSAGTAGVVLKQKKP